MHKVRTLPLTLLFFSLILALGVDAADDKCAKVNLYECPACDGSFVTDCLDCDGFLNTDNQQNACFDRQLFDTSDPHYHYLWNDIAAIFVWFIAAGIATACGVGGGGIYVPLGMILLVLAPKVSSGLSQASIFGASLGGLILNIQNKHPNEAITEDNSDSAKTYTRPLIDYDMALFLAPMEMAGAVMGVLVQKILPNWAYLMIAGVILFFTSHKTYMKFYDAYKKEKALKVSLLETEKSKKKTEASEARAGEVEMVTVDENGQTIAKKKEEASSTTDDSFSVLSPDQKSLRRKYLDDDARQYPREKLLAFLLLWMGLFVITLLKGGKGTPSLIGITCDSPWYIVLIASQFVWTLGFALVYALKILKGRTARDEVQYPFLPQDVNWTPKKTQFYAVFTFAAGIVAGLIGIGGGMVLGPLMIVMGIHPRVSSATTATMIILTSSSVAVMFVTSGLVPWEYAALYFSVCLSGAYIGKTVIDGYVKRTGAASLLIFILATIIGLATLGCFYNAISGLAASDWCFDGFKKFCDVGVEKEGGCGVARMLLGKFYEEESYYQGTW